MEGTSTLVLGSPNKYFVDVRLVIPLSSVATRLEQVDWAFAGTSEHDSTVDPPHAVFHHWVDSRHPDAEGILDEGDMHPGNVPGEVLERGVMVNPSGGKLEPYEECWVDQEPDGQDGCVVRHEDGKGARGLMIRTGTRVQAVLRVGDEMSVGRWNIVQPGGLWEAVAAVGDQTSVPGALPPSLKLGETVKSENGRGWVCVESW